MDDLPRHRVRVQHGIRVRLGRRHRHGHLGGLWQRLLPHARVRRLLSDRLAHRRCDHALAVGAVRAAYLALVLGLAGGLGLATVVLSGGGPAAVTVAAALDLDDGADVDRRREAAVAVLTARCMASLGFDWLAIPDSAPSVPDASLDPVSWADRWGFGVSTMIGRSESTPLPDRNLEALARLPAAEQTAARSALHGSSVRPGCAEMASTDVYGSRERAMAPIRAALAALD